MTDKIHILLLEDDPDHQELFRLHLSMTDFAQAQLYIVRSLLEGREQLEQRPFDIVFIDLSLPDSDFQETLHDLANLPSIAPKIVLSSLDDKQALQNIIQQGADDYMSKMELNSSSLERTIRYNINRWQLNRELNHQKQRLEEIIWGANVGTWEWNTQTGKTVFNQRWAEIVGYKLQELEPIGIHTWESLAHPDDLQASQAQLIRLFNQEIDFYEMEIRMRHKKGHWVWLMDRGKVVERDTEGRPLRLSGTHTDITERKQTAKKLELAAKVFENTEEGILITDADCYIVDLNPALSAITGYSRSELIGQKPSILKSGRHDRDFYEQMWDELIERGKWCGEVWNRKKNGSVYAERLNISTIYSPSHQPEYYVGLLHDITLVKEQQSALEQIAHYDVLTRLPNRLLLVDRFKQIIAHNHRSNNLIVIGYLDLDGFKPVNDSYGHHIGDQLLIEVAKRIQKNLRESDTISRQGGDEFVLLLSDLSSKEQTEHIIQRIHLEVAKSYEIAGHDIHISASGGYTIYTDNNKPLDEWLTLADQAMYQAKQQGKNRYVFY